MYFHGPTYQVVQAAWRDGDQSAARMRADLPPNHSSDAATIAHPRLIELCFQTAGLWEAGREGRLALPTHVDSATILAQPEAGAALTCLSRQGEDGSFECVVADQDGNVAVHMRGYRTVTLPVNLADDVREPIARVMAD
jgi:hypothetical protein